MWGGDVCDKKTLATIMSKPLYVTGGGGGNFGGIGGQELLVTKKIKMKKKKKRCAGVYMYMCVYIYI